MPRLGSVLDESLRCSREGSVLVPPRHGGSAKSAALLDAIRVLIIPAVAFLSGAYVWQVVSVGIEISPANWTHKAPPAPLPVQAFAAYCACLITPLCCAFLWGWFARSPQSATRHGLLSAVGGEVCGLIS